MTTVRYVSRESETGEIVVYDIFAATAVHQLRANGCEILAVEHQDEAEIRPAS